MMRQLSIIILFLSYLTICDDTDPNIATSVKISNDGKVSEFSTDDESIANSPPSNSMDNTYDRNDLISKRIEDRLETLQSQISELQTYISKQDLIINSLNETLSSFVFTADSYGIIYDSTDDRPLLLTSSHSHNISFKMLNVISVRLPKRDSFIKKGKRNKRDRNKNNKRKRKTRYIHVIITLNSEGIFQLWDDEQNELYSYKDSNITINNNIAIYSDIITQHKYGNTWFIIAPNNNNFIKIYSISAWRNYINDKYNIKKSVMEGDITAENIIYRPQNYTNNDVTVTDVTIYKQQRKQYIIVSYSDGLLFSYKRNGKLSSSSRSIPYKSPNKTIIKISSTPKKYQMIIITEIGFQFLKLPKLTKIGPFCHLPKDIIINEIKFDTITTSIMYLTTTNGILLVYNIKKLNRKMCKFEDNFTIYPNSPIKINTIPGYLLITSINGLHVYNVSKKKSSKYIHPGLIFIRKFENQMDKSDVLFSSYTDGHQRTLIAYVQTNNNNINNNNNLSYEFVVLESYLPSFNPLSEKGGILGIVSKAPIFVGIAMFAFFWVFFKGKGGSGGGLGNSPLGRLGKIFGGGGRKNRKTYSRGGSSDIRGKKDRWSSRHPGMSGGGGGSSGGGNIPRYSGPGGNTGLSANMRYGNRNNTRKF